MTSPVAILKQSQGQGGLELHTMALVKGILQRGRAVDFLYQGPAQWPALEGMRLIERSPKGLFRYLNLLRYHQTTQKWMASHRYSAVLGLERHFEQTHYRAGSGVHRYFLEQRLGRGSWAKKWKLHLSPYHQLVLKLEAQTFGPSGASRIYTNSKKVAHQISSYYQTPSERIVVIPNGVPWQALEPYFKQSIDFSMDHPLPHGLGRNARYLLFVGHGYERKGLLLALEALAASKSHFHLIVVGRDSRVDRYQRAAHELGLSKRVHWLGQVDPRPLYGISEALLLPTLYDPCANVTLEAVATGNYAITSVEDGASELLENISGVGLHLNELDSWISAIEERWSTPPTIETRTLVRSTVAHLEWQQQINRLVEDFLATSS